jgi:hypothetical protein
MSTIRADIDKFIQAVFMHPMVELDGRLIPSSLPSALRLQGSLLVPYYPNVHSSEAYPLLLPKYFHHQLQTVIIGLHQNIPPQALLDALHVRAEAKAVGYYIQRGSRDYQRPTPPRFRPSTLTIIWHAGSTTTDPVKLRGGFLESISAQGASNEYRKLTTSVFFSLWLKISLKLKILGS